MKETAKIIIVACFAIPGAIVGFAIRGFREGYNIAYECLSKYLEEDEDERQE